MVERLDAARYWIIAGALIACFNNLIDEINKGSGILHIALFSGVLLLFAVILVFVSNRYVLAGVLCASGMIMLIQGFKPGEILAGTIFIGYSMHLVKNEYFNYVMYCLLGLVIVVGHVFGDSGPEDMLNVMVGHAVILALNKMIYEAK